ncbi:hypothetical protein [Fodinicola feengrottensis]|uniref:hypothetical protein n=1 Tax=Fodinicola feengrottensis TaxID=435914 RepID=UPI0024414071|nr:hypothetical protein [Fodinicola feengrottensis]
MTGVATGVRRRTTVRFAPVQRRAPGVRPVVRMIDSSLVAVPVRRESPFEIAAKRQLREALVVGRSWAAVIAASAALVAVLLQLYMSDEVAAVVLVPEWVPSVAVLIGLLAALAVRSAGRLLLPRRFVVGFGWLSAGLLAWSAGCLSVHDALRVAHAAPMAMVWNGLLAHGLALLAAMLLAVRTYRFQRTTRGR